MLDDTRVPVGTSLVIFAAPLGLLLLTIGLATGPAWIWAAGVAIAVAVFGLHLLATPPLKKPPATRRT